MQNQSNIVKKSGIGFGVTTLVTILMVLLLTTFSVLTLVSARYDHNLSRMTMDATGNYYAADREACEWLAELSDLVDSSDHADLIDLIAAASPDAVVAISESGDLLLVTRSFSIDNRNQLRVSIAIMADGRLTVVEWASISNRSSQSNQ
ncbi:MAG: hypothetical protein FWD45_02635 [Coriobacteriia bacterium]|nr:hypothetical protein [Coriobacteriia bacterium]